MTMFLPQNAIKPFAANVVITGGNTGSGAEHLVDVL